MAGDVNKYLALALLLSGIKICFPANPKLLILNSSYSNSFILVNFFKDAQQTDKFYSYTKFFSYEITQNDLAVNPDKFTQVYCFFLTLKQRIEYKKRLAITKKVLKSM